MRANQARGSTARVRILRRQSEETKPSIGMERALLVTEACRLYSGTVSAPMLRALVFRHLLEHKSIFIGEGELIVGERGAGPQVTPTYPELCCHSLEDLDVISSREKISFHVDEEARRLQAEEVIPFWQGRSMRDRVYSLMSEEWHRCYRAGIFTEFMEQRAPGHTVAGARVFQRGMYDLVEEIEEQLSRLDFLADAEAPAKSEQLQAMKIAAEALVTYARRHAALAREKAASCSDEERRHELLELARVCERVPARAPRTMHEALQHYWFIHLGVISELNTWDSFCPGRLDQHLEAFYEQDLAGGLLDREGARELLECFWVKFNNQPAPPKVGITLRESGTYTDFANINLGGLRPDGSDGVNAVTYLLLEVIGEMRLLQPSSNIQVSKKSPDLFLHRAGEVIREGWGQPSVFNADAVIQELLNQGKSLDDARQGGTSGCVETGAFGTESYILSGYFNLVKVLEITLNGGCDPRSGEQLGPEGPLLEKITSFAALMEAFARQLRYFLEVKIRGNQLIERLYATEMPAPFLSLLIEDCIARGQDYNAGGARYNSHYIQGVGIGTITDCLAALKKHLYDEPSLDGTNLRKVLAADFAGREELRRFLLKSTPHYGNDDDCADELMQRVFSLFHGLVDGRRSYRGATYRINMLPTTCHVYFGAVTGATPDGRRAGTPLSEGISPVQGRDIRGPTAVIRSAAKMDHLRTGGTLLNLKFSPPLLEGDEGLQRLAHLIRAYFRMDGHHVQFNVVHAETLRRAQREPEAYGDLIVRVAGYSDYFNNLGLELQEEIIVRTAHGREA